MDKERPLVSVIIINLNGKKYLEDCLESLTKVTYTGVEIILVDNNSTDDSIEFVKNNYPSIIIKLDRNYGFAYPNNVGAKNAKGDFLLFLNNDTIVHPDFITELVKVLKKDPQIGICQSLLLKPTGEVDSSGDFVDDIGVAYSSKEKFEELHEILSARGASMMIRKEIFEKLGGFDEKFFVSFEDVDLGWRCWILGYKVVIIPQSVVYHLGGQTVYKMKYEMAFHGLKNQLCMKITNFETKFAIRSLLLFFTIYGFKMIRVVLDYKFRGKTSIRSTKYDDILAQKPNPRAILMSLIWICRNFRYLGKKRKQVNSCRAYSTNELQKLNVIRSRK